MLEACEPIIIYEKNDFDEFNQYMSNIKEDSVHRKIILVEYLSIFITSFCFLLTSYLAYNDNSVTALAIAIDTFLDILSYVICIWRYSNIKNNSDPKQTQRKDMIASISLALLFLTSAFWVEMQSVKSYIYEEKPSMSLLFIIIAIFQSALFSILAIIKFYLARKTKSNSVIISDGINCLVASFSNLSMAISMTFYITYGIWYLDSLFGFCIGILVFIYGTQLLLSNCF